MALLLFARVDGKRKRRVDGGVEFSHVVVDFGLADRRIGGANMRNELSQSETALSPSVGSSSPV